MFVNIFGCNKKATLLLEFETNFGIIVRMIDAVIIIVVNDTNYNKFINYFFKKRKILFELVFELILGKLA